ncbi:MAG: hypothetical protein C4525_07140 [Desulfarculus sp.]|jgi:hypothetical protein|nr:MAG: hypothetical protein C4525_07140 [Desulfarculus sp.]
MRYFTGLLALMVFSALAASGAWGQDEVMTLNAADKGQNQRPPVVFSHGKHSKAYACLNCHHEYDKNFSKTGTEGGNCADCHQPRATADNSVPLNLAFHQQCKACHLRLIQARLKSGPVMCGDCHLRKK